MTVVDFIDAHARAMPDHPALLIDDAKGTSCASVSYAELIEGVTAVALQLTQRGVEAGHRCGVQAREGRDFIIAALGIMAAGLCMVPIADEYGDEALATFAEKTKLHHLWRNGALTSYDAGASLGQQHFRGLRPAYLRYTSGTTAQPKGVVIGHDAVLARIDAANQGLRINPEDRILWLLPMAHHFVVSILLYLRCGATILLPSSTLARRALGLAERGGATVIYASPFHYKLLAKDNSGLMLDRVRLAVSTATGLRGETAIAFKQRFGIDLVQALGIMEVGLPLMNIVSAATKPTSLGRPLPGYQVELRDEGGRDVTASATVEQPGEICIRGPGMFDAYLDPWVLAADLTVAQGFRTGDQGWFDRDGDLHLAGRRDNRISMAGMKFFCEEVEAVLDEHAAVRQSRVSGRPHAHLGEVAVASIVPADRAHPPTPEELSDHCRRILPPHKVPREFTIVDALPETITGKLRRG